MSSTTSSSSGFFSSPRSQQRLMWISGAVLVIGVGVFLGVFFSRGSSQPQTIGIATLPTPPQTDTTPAQEKKVPASPAALGIARTFLLTAVLRKNLAVAYPLVGPDLKGGMSLAQWRKGSIPVQPYPAQNAKTTHFVVTQSTKDHLMMQVALAARPGLKIKSITFWLGVDRIGGKWLVNYWAPDYNPLKSKANPYSN